MAKVQDRRRFNGRKPGTMSAAERAAKSVACFDQWVNPDIRQKRHEGIRRAADARIARRLADDQVGA